MTLDEIRDRLKPSVKKLDKRDAPFFYAQKASDSRPILVVGEPGKPLSGPVMALAKAKAVDVITGMCARTDTGIVFRVRTGRVAMAAELAIRVSFRDLQLEGSLAKSFLVKEAAKPEPDPIEEEQGLRAAAAMIEEAEEENRKAAEAWRTKVKQVDQKGRSVAKKLEDVKTACKELDLKAFRGITNKTKEMGEARKNLTQDEDGKLAGILKTILEIEVSVRDAAELLDRIPHLQRHQLDEHRKARFAPAVRAWEALQAELSKEPIDFESFEGVLVALDDLSDLVDRRDTLRRRVDFVTKCIDGAKTDTDLHIRTFCEDARRQIREFSTTVGSRQLENPELEQQETWIAGLLDGWAQLRPEERPPAEPEVTFNEVRFHKNAFKHALQKCGDGQMLLDSLAAGTLNDEHPKRPMFNRPLHRHADGGKKGVAFTYVLGKDGEATPWVYDFADNRIQNRYQWTAGDSSGPAKIPAKLGS